MHRFAIFALTGIVLTGCSSGSLDLDSAAGTQAATLEGWANDNAAGVSEGADLMGAVAAAADDMDVPGLIAACSDLGAWADEMSSLPPAPDATVDGPWQEALSEAAIAADDCVEGAETMDPDLLSSSADHIATFSERIGDTTRALEAAR